MIVLSLITTWDVKPNVYCVQVEPAPHWDKQDYDWDCFKHTMQLISWWNRCVSMPFRSVAHSTDLWYMVAVLYHRASGQETSDDRRLPLHGLLLHWDHRVHPPPGIAAGGTWWLGRGNRHYDLFQLVACFLTDPRCSCPSCATSASAASLGLLLVSA